MSNESTGAKRAIHASAMAGGSGKVLSNPTEADIEWLAAKCEYSEKAKEGTAYKGTLTNGHIWYVVASPLKSSP